MSTLPEKFNAFVVERDDESVVRGLRVLSLDDLGEGDVDIRVHWSGVNYKDGLAAVAGGQVARISPLVPGIDLAGEVVDAGSSSFAVGSPVIVHGYQLGVAHHGGYSECARVPAGWVVPLPAGLTLREAMTIGTAGFTAALSVHQLEERGLRPGDGPVLVTGASGGVGTVAVDILAKRGYEVVASSGKSTATDLLLGLGAAKVVGRAETSGKGKPLEREVWAGAVDCVGASTLPYILRTLKYGAAVAASGLTGGDALESTVLPFILRGVALLGVDSVQCSIELRRTLWNRLATDFKPRNLANIATNEVDLEGVSTALDTVLAGEAVGRTVVRLG